MYIKKLLHSLYVKVSNTISTCNIFEKISKIFTLWPLNFHSSPGE